MFFHINEKETILVKQLDLFKDQENIIRCYGRVNHSSLSLSEKQPILLLSKHPFSDLIILDHHKIAHHNGIKKPLNNIRGKYWIGREREAVKCIVRRCLNWKQRCSITPKLHPYHGVELVILHHLQTPELISPDRFLSLIEFKT